MKPSLLFATCLSCLSLSANAQPPDYRMPQMGYGGYGAPHAMQPARRPVQQPQVAPEVAEAGAVLKAGIGKLLAFFQNTQSPSQQQLAEFLDREISPYFNFSYMAEWAVGPMKNRLNDQQMQEVENQLKAQFLTAMAQKLSSFDQQSVQYLAPKFNGPNQVTLSIAISNRGSYPARLDFRLYKGSGWRVYDVSANGSSALMYYRNYFTRYLKMQMMQNRLRR
ncbi:MAG: ABC transporter substrate-binding protein [Chromatiales bacterium]|jgi:phospholipid transport system substrate-binding protein